MGELLLPAKRSVASVCRGEWVSAESLTDIKRVENLVKRPSRSPEPERLLPGEKPAKLADDGQSWEESRWKTGLNLMIPQANGDSSSYIVLDEGRRSFAGLIRSALPSSTGQDYFERIHDNAPWIQPEGPLGPLPRKTC